VTVEVVDFPQAADVSRDDVDHLKWAIRWRFLVYRVQRTMCGHSWTTEMSNIAFPLRLLGKFLSTIFIFQYLTSFSYFSYCWCSFFSYCCLCNKICTYLHKVSKNVFFIATESMEFKPRQGWNVHVGINRPITLMLLILPFNETINQTLHCDHACMR
jgi:hypothetical protein